MAQEARLKVRGLYTQPNPYSEVPDGALTVADNLVIDREGTATPRRGFQYCTGSFGGASDRATALTEYQTQVVLHYGDDTLARYNGTTYTDYSGTIAAPTSERMRFAQASGNLYFTTSAGVKKLDSVTNTIGSVGVPKGIQISGTTTGASGFLANTESVAYRAVWCLKDANNNLILGAPSQRAEVTNSAGGNRNISVTVSIPAGITTSNFVQIYRSRDAGAGITPSDELFLVYEYAPTSGNITAGSFTFTDETPEELLGASLYTNESQEGIVAANDQPPLAKDITVYQDHLFFANTVGKYRFNLTLLGVGGTNGLVADDTITIAGRTYTASKTPQGTTTSGNNTITSVSSTVGINTGDTIFGPGIPAGTTVSSTGASTIVMSANATASATVNLCFERASARTYAAFTGSAYSAAQSIALTANSLVRMINQDSGQTTVYAYYTSNGEDLPGKILLEERSIGGAVWTVQVAGGTSPELAWGPEGLDTAQNATNDDWDNGLYYSKKQQPDAVPILNYVRVGSANDPILRIVALRDSLFIFKQTEGIYRLSGAIASEFAVTLFDSSARLLAKNSLVVLNNQIYGYFDQGVCSVSETGVSVVSRQIERTLLELQGFDLTNVKDQSWALGYESDRKYILHTVIADGNAYTQQAFVLNTFTNAWTKWNVTYQAGFVRPSEDVMYVARRDTNRISKERKTYSYADQADEALSRTITAVSGTTVTLNTAENVAVGDVLYQTSSIFAPITAVSGNTVSTSFEPGFTAAACEIQKAFTCTAQWAPYSGGMPLLKKHWREASILFEFRPRNSSMYFSTDMVPAETEVAITGESVGAWGAFAWGSQPWGGANLAKIARTYVSRDHQRSASITLKWATAQAYSAFAISGAQLVFNPYQEAERSTR
jgi:hypothetical protein